MAAPDRGSGGLPGVSTCGRHRRSNPHLHAATRVLHNQGMSVLRFDNVSKQYAGGHQALVDVSFDVAPGEMLFVTGHSGAGKSTLLKLIHLDERPSRGAVIFDERNLLKVRGGNIPRHRREVGAVYQDHRLLMDRSIAENVALPLILRGTRRAEIGKRVRSVLERMGLGHREKALPSQLSAGEQQRVGIARAIVGEPKLLVADEPTGNLDPTLAAEIMALFAELPERGTSVLVVSHDLALLRHMRKRVLILDHGKLIDDISPQDLAE
ncbi:Cell division ATP-binding protein FtsE [compost metagenome]